MRSDSGRKIRGVSASVAELYLSKMIFAALFCKSCRFFFRLASPDYFRLIEGLSKTYAEFLSHVQVKKPLFFMLKEFVDLSFY